MDDQKKAELNFLLHQMNDPEAGEIDYNDHQWRTKVIPKMEDGDINGMKQAAAPFVQYEMTRLALSGKSESTRLAAGQFVLGQGGHGMVQKHQVQVDYAKIPADQLVAMIAAKLTSIQRLNPSFDPSSLLVAARVSDAQEVYATQEIHDAHTVNAEVIDEPSDSTE